MLDNVEQLVDVAGPLFARLREAAPEARWLATSRQPLAILGEWVHEVQPLALAHAGGGDSDAMRMLCDGSTGRAVRRSRTASARSSIGSRPSSRACRSRSSWRRRGSRAWAPRSSRRGSRSRWRC